MQAVSLCVSMFQHTAARRRLGAVWVRTWRIQSFNTQPPEGGWHLCQYIYAVHAQFQHTAARRRLVFAFIFYSIFKGFNTQPPEGGWAASLVCHRPNSCFNTQPPEGGWH